MRLNRLTAPAASPLWNSAWIGFRPASSRTQGGLKPRRIARHSMRSPRKPAKSLRHPSSVKGRSAGGSFMAIPKPGAQSIEARSRTHAASPKAAPVATGPGRGGTPQAMACWQYRVVSHPQALPNPSLKRRPNGGPAGPRSGFGYLPLRGPAVPPSPPA